MIILPEKPDFLKKIKFKRVYWLYIINFLIFALLFLVNTSFEGALQIRKATPLLLFPFLTAFAINNEELPSFTAGLLIGICLDAVTIGSFCFNTIVLALIGAATSFTSKYLFNKNIRAAIVLALFGALIYFIFNWLFKFAFVSGVKNSIIYLLEYAIPSAIYTAVFVIPAFYLQRKLQKLRT